MLSFLRFTGEVLEMHLNSRGLDDDGVLHSDVIVNGRIPVLPTSSSAVQHLPYNEDLVQAGPGQVPCPPPNVEGGHKYWHTCTPKVARLTFVASGVVQCFDYWRAYPPPKEISPPHRLVHVGQFFGAKRNRNRPVP